MLNSFNAALGITSVIEEQFLTGTLDMTLAIALKKMVRQRDHCDLSDHGAIAFQAPNCLVIEQDGKLCGIFTEKDLPIRNLGLRPIPEMSKVIKLNLETMSHETKFHENFFAW